jgi:hypothetical protein
VGNGERAARLSGAPGLRDPVPCECTLQPIPKGSGSAHNRFMVQFAIRCNRSVPVQASELEKWLDQQVLQLRADAPHGTIRLSTLTQRLPSGDSSIGWLLEFELSDAEEAKAREHLDEALRDMRLLGFQPTLLARDFAHIAVARDGATS